ncbi:hypothetical protein TNCV_3311381 [Trichonephila clavipes]|nr:hypothetical protein TNCV_3311381 [Trichonephila clavipes]
MPSTSSIPVFSTSTQVHLLPFTSSESQLLMPNSTTSTTINNILNTSASTLSNKVQLAVILLNTATAKSNSRTSAVSKAAHNCKQSKENGAHHRSKA